MNKAGPRTNSNKQRMTAGFGIARAAGVASVLALVALSGCEEAPSVLQPAGEEAEQIKNLAWILLGIAVFIFLVVETWLITNIIRFSKPRDEKEVSQTHGDIRLELVYTIIPVMIVIVIFVFTVQTMDSLQAPGSDMHIKVTGKQWWWEIEYPEAGVITANEFYVPVETRTLAELHSSDVIHSFWMPEIGGKTDMVPGQTNQTMFTVTRPGRYLGQCSEFCGVQHAHMRFLMFAVSREEFSDWIAHQQQPAKEPTSEAARRGREEFVAAGCGGCHTIRGTEAAGRLGPDLTHLAGRETLAAYTLTNTTENLREWIADPQEVKPGNLMPDLDLEPERLEAIVTYLEGLE
ncbi:MAG: cytochrome c oxidase subunit II [Thermoleophilia bacterium]